MLMNGQRNTSKSSVSILSNLGPLQAVNTGYVLDGDKGRYASCQTRGMALQSSQFTATQQDITGNENILSKAGEASRRQITYKANRLHTEQGPDSSKAFLSAPALCTLSTESFD